MAGKPNWAKSFSNHEIVTVAVYLLGGKSRRADTEDVAIKANELAPGRFAWRKYPEQINIDTVRKRLWDATKPEKGGYLLGSERDGWLLTNRGLRFAKRVARGLGDAPLSRKRVNLTEKNWLRRERARMLASDAFLNFRTVGLDAVTHQQAENFFRVDDYVLGDQRERKLVRMLNVFGEDAELGEAVRKLADKVREKSR